jgi:hypothetical protein
MRTRTRPLPRYLGLALALLACGCGGSPPLTEVEGTVLLNDQPLPNALVRFVPELPGQEGTLTSVAITDAQGRFRLTCEGKNAPGAVVGKHRVVVTEAPPPEEFRGMSRKAQEGYAAYRARQKNRPIPVVYGNLWKTPLQVEVKQDQKTYPLNLTRKG